jgi:hypothetical protein
MEVCGKATPRPLYTPEIATVFIALVARRTQGHAQTYVEIRKPLDPTGVSGWLSRYSDTLRAERSVDRIPVGARFLAPVLIDLGAHPASYRMGTGSLPGGTAPGRCVAPRLKKSRAIPLLPLCVFMTCYRANFTFTLPYIDPTRTSNPGPYSPYRVAISTTLSHIT